MINSLLIFDNKENMTEEISNIPTQPIQNPPIIPNKNSKKNSLIIILLAFLLLGIIVIIGLLIALLLPSKKSEQLAIIPTPTVQTEISPIANEIQPTITPENLPNTTPTIKITGSLYESEKYGFNITFPYTWKGYVVAEKMIDFGEFKAPVLYFGLPAQTDIFAVGIYTKEEWQTLENSEGPKDELLGSNTNYTFGYSLGQYAANDEMALRRNEVKTFVSETFKTK